MPQPKITLYVDIVSPFGYIAFYLLKVQILRSILLTTPANPENKNSPVFKQCEITYVPILLGGLMNACGNTPPLRIKSNLFLHTQSTCPRAHHDPR